MRGKRNERAPFCSTDKNNRPVLTCYHKVLLPITRRQILHSSKLKEFADDNFKFDGYGESYPNGQKTLWEKEKLLVTSNFSFSHSVFKKACFPEVLKGVIVWEWVNPFPNDKF